MARTTRLLVFDRFGPPPEVIRLEAAALPELGPRDVRVRMRLAPINPADLNILEGKYGQLPDLPAVGGKEGAGEVVETGAAVESLRPGDLVAPPWTIGSWREEFVAPESAVLPFPKGLSVEQSALLAVNPATAWRMLHDFSLLLPGDWIIQNAANSAVGRSVIQIAHAKGWRTINLVRRAAEREAELRRLGADAVLEDAGRVDDAVRDATGGRPVSLALNAVGGDSVLRLIGQLGFAAPCVTYGSMSRQLLKIPAGPLIFQDIRFIGFWVSRWYGNASRDNILSMWRDLAVCLGQEPPPIERAYPLEEASAAVAHALQPSRQGKIVFAIPPQP